MTYHKHCEIVIVYVERPCQFLFSYDKIKVPILITVEEWINQGGE